MRADSMAVLEEMIGSFAIPQSSKLNEPETQSQQRPVDRFHLEKSSSSPFQ